MWQSFPESIKLFIDFSVQLVAVLEKSIYRKLDREVNPYKKVATFASFFCVHSSMCAPFLFISDEHIFKLPTAANIYLFGFILTKCKYIYRSFQKILTKLQRSVAINLLVRSLVKEPNVQFHTLVIKRLGEKSILKIFELNIFDFERFLQFF